ncbi:MAG TPA: serine/threonine-protein kinase, partial [Polyangiaceae bacterium]|nr:serine/threonine-protein kinase [Polyangiaceae bacterium]
MTIGSAGRGGKRLAAGELVDGRFHVIELAGSGGMGEVYRATDTATGEVVALKVMTEEAGFDPRFLREAELLRALDHAGIVGHVGHGVGPRGVAYIAMRWAAGETLERRLERGPLDADATVLLARALASTLAYAHARGVVHRDLKPSNVMLRGGRLDAPVLLDFGVARGGKAGPTL